MCFIIERYTDLCPLFLWYTTLVVGYYIRYIGLGEEPITRQGLSLVYQR